MALSKKDQVEEILKCGKDPIYFIKNYLYIQHPTKGRLPFRLYPFQEECIESFLDYKYNIVLKSRQLGLSTTTAAYCLWMALFRQDANILLMATKLEVGKGMIEKIRTAFKMLPAWMLNLLELKVPDAESVKYIKFTNGSKITAIPTSKDAARGEAVTLLVIDECVAGETLITIRNKKTEWVRKVQIERLFDEEFNGQLVGEHQKLIDEWEVLTPDGWSSFSGIKMTERDEVVELRFNDSEKSLVCSLSHQIRLSDGNGFIEAEDAVVGGEMFGGKHITNKRKIKQKTKLYDLLNVEKGHQYWTDDVVSHNCAHIENLEELWMGLWSTVSTGGRAIVFSTPKGRNFFQQMWMGAEVPELEPNKVGQICKGVGKNGFHGIKLPWFVHPERDDEWFDAQSKAMDPRGIAQELLCSFEGSSLTFFSQVSIDYVRNLSFPPIAFTGPAGKGLDLQIWKEPVEGHRYVLSADVARGDAEDFSAFHVFDINKSEVVAEYLGKIPPDRFGEWLIEVGKKYNMALIVAEKNTVGIATAIKLRDSGYPNLYYDEDLANRMLTMTPDEKKECLPGFTITPKNREKILENLEQVIRNNHLRLYSTRFVSEMESFIWNGKRGQALKKRHDDLIMAMAIGLQVFTPNAEQQNYFDILAANQGLAKAMLAGMSRGGGNGKVGGKKIPSFVNKETVQLEMQFRKEFGWLY